MKRTSSFITLLCLALCGSVWAQKNNSTASSLLWKLSRQDRKEVSYLMGTMHMICKEDYMWTPAMQKSFEHCKRLCLEMDISDNNLMMEAGAMMLDMSGNTLRDYFKSEEDYEAVTRYIEDSLGQNMQMAEHLKPVALYMIYTTGMMKTPCRETVSYELKLVEQAKAKNYTIKGLETVAEQMAALESIPTDTIIQQLVRIAKGEKDDEATLSKLVSAFKHQDLELLNQLTVSNSSENGMDGKILIDNRNKQWVPAMDKMMQAEPVFFAVGAGHLHGLLELLRAAGYTVEAVK